MKRDELIGAIVSFWSQVRRDGDRCWLWTGELNSTGYGRLEWWSGAKRERILAHRLAYLLFTGDDIAGLVVRHDCDTPLCCNPAHLRSGTQADNIQDAIERNRANFDGLAKGRANKAAGLEAKLQSQEKQCPNCQATKPLDAFHKARGSADGRQGWCKSCRSQKLRDAWQNDPGFRERELARKRERRAAQPKADNSPRTHCGNDHELTPENRGARGQCKQCARDRARRAQEKKRANVEAVA
ncbi:hypothetical protein DMB42_11780 [Nonomuraea sp. WAC 01424]|uniref:HNH endonuclease signature motif containing protein n=1 Tax=Nonomuraea sp. WAC 01424 TaxID=2203200 RepID=UPI000F7A166F|nr:HNH endonuclease signature motif containing protein [Nonomuraea sp. WAC 01424]RSN12851.1 hypothetical protein DMB42_11780 [Nonomuraea sp. WAC 01424]